MNDFFLYWIHFYWFFVVFVEITIEIDVFNRLKLISSRTSEFENLRLHGKDKYHI